MALLFDYKQEKDPVGESNRSIARPVRISNSTKKHLDWKYIKRYSLLFFALKGIKNGTHYGCLYKKGLREPRKE